VDGSRDQNSSVRSSCVASCVEEGNPRSHDFNSATLGSLHDVVRIGVVLSVCGPVSIGRKSVGAWPYIECVFDNDDLVELDAAGTLAAAEANEQTLITAETRRLQIAAHWADLHVRREALVDRLEVRDLHRRLVAAGRLKLRAA
jgi:hypothetical protein